jgi:hypothetical protein
MIAEDGIRGGIYHGLVREFYYGILKPLPPGW